MAFIRQSPAYGKYLTRLGWVVEKIGSDQAFVRRLPILGGIVKLQRPRTLDPMKIKELMEKYDAFQAIVEPTEETHSEVLKKAGFKQTSSPYLPSKTIQLDLTKSMEKIYFGAKKDTRAAIRKTEDIKVYSIDKIDAFRKSWHEAVRTKRFVPRAKNLAAIKESFKEDALFLVTPNGESGAIFIKSNEGTYYWQAFNSEKGRDMLAQYKIVWAGISWAKERGAKVFDFEGIYDERFPLKSWIGFSHFKKSFGGTIVTYPGAFTKYRLF